MDFCGKGLSLDLPKQLLPGIKLLPCAPSDKLVRSLWASRMTALSSHSPPTDWFPSFSPAAIPWKVILGGRSRYGGAAGSELHSY